MNVNEYGIQFVLYTGFNMAAFSAISLTFTKPDGTTLAVTNPAVSVSGATLTTPIGTFGPNTYLLYTFASGDVNQSGNWSVRGFYTDTSPLHLISIPATFVIGT